MQNNDSKKVAVRATRHITLVALQVSTQSPGESSATVTLEIDGVRTRRHANALGPIDAIVKAITLIVPHNAKLEHYEAKAIGSGPDAAAEATVKLTEGEHAVIGHSANKNTLAASVHAYVRALNKLVALDAHLIQPTNE